MISMMIINIENYNNYYYIANLYFLIFDILADNIVVVDKMDI